MVMKFLKAYTVDMEDFLRETGYLPANAEPEHNMPSTSFCYFSSVISSNSKPRLARIALDGFP